MEPYQSSLLCSQIHGQSLYHKKCKENAENHHVSKKEMEFIVFLTQRQPLATFSPEHLDTNLDHKDMFSCCSIQVHQTCLAQKWVQWESESQQETKIVWWHLLHQDEREEVTQALNLRPSSKLPAYMAEVMLTLAQQICASRMQLKTAVEEMTAGPSTNQYSWEVETCLNTYLDFWLYYVRYLSE